MIAVGDHIDVAVVVGLGTRRVDDNGNVLRNGERNGINDGDGVVVVRVVEAAGVADVEFAVAGADAVGVATHPHGGLDL